VLLGGVAVDNDIIDEGLAGCCEAFVDDVIIYSNTAEEHENNCRAVFPPSATPRLGAVQDGSQFLISSVLSGSALSPLRVMMCHRNLIFVDDVIIYSNTAEEHENNCRAVFPPSATPNSAAVLL
jgi:hypothetical protein